MSDDDGGDGRPSREEMRALREVADAALDVVRLYSVADAELAALNTALVHLEEVLRRERESRHD